MAQTLTVKEKASGRNYTAYVQAVDLNYRGEYVLRYIIGIQGHTEFSFLRAVYSNDEFNRDYEVVKDEWN